LQSEHLYTENATYSQGLDANISWNLFFVPWLFHLFPMHYLIVECFSLLASVAECFSQACQ